MIAPPRLTRFTRCVLCLGLALTALLSARAIAAPRAVAHAARPAPSTTRHSAATANDTLAWVDSHTITRDDLRRRIELMPWPVKHGRASLDSARVKALESLVAEQLLADQARRDGLDQSSHLVRTREALRRTLVRDALYRDVTRGVADPAPDAITRAMIARTPGRAAERTASLRRVVADSLGQLSAGLRARTFMEQTLEGQRAAVDSVSLLMLADTLRSLMAATTRESGGALAGTGEFADLLLDRLAPSLDRPLVRMSDGDLTLGDCIGAMRFYPFTLHAQTRRNFAAELSARLKEMVEGERMTREALRRGLANDAEVVRELDRWTTAWLAQLMLERAAAEPQLTTRPGKASAAKRAEARDRSIAALAARSRVRLDYAALRRTPIVPSNMVTKRMIGFGGGMMAAPMLAPLWNWAGYWRDAPPLP